MIMSRHVCGIAGLGSSFINAVDGESLPLIEEERRVDASGKNAGELVDLLLPKHENMLLGWNLADDVDLLA